jgi:hypothetical protein
MCGRWLAAHALAVAFVLAAADDVRADQPPEVQRSIALFEQGRRRIDAHDCPGAIPLFLESVRLHESVGARISLAECYQKTEPLLAWRSLKKAEDVAERATDNRAAYARERARELEARLAMVELRITKTTRMLPGFELRIDATLVEARYLDGAAIAVEPGKHTLRATAPGKRPWTANVDVVVGSAAQALVALEDEEGAARGAPPPDATPPTSNVGDTQRSTGIVVGAVGIVGVGVGAVFGLVARSKLQDAQAACSGYPSCAPGSSAASANDANDSANHAATISTIALIAGSVAVAAGAALYLTAPRAGSPQAYVAPRIGGIELGATW